MQKKMLIIGAALTLALAAAGPSIRIGAAQEAPVEIGPVELGAPAADEAPGDGLPGRPVANEGASHASQCTAVTYAHNPPASGTHYPTWARPGVYVEPVPVGKWVHSLEHGYIVILYDCAEPCPELTEQLRQFYETAPKSERFRYQKLVVTPASGLAHRLTILAWDRIDELDDFDGERLLAFYQAFHDRGPEVAG